MCIRDRTGIDSITTATASTPGVFSFVHGTGNTGTSSTQLIDGEIITTGNNAHGLNSQTDGLGEVIVRVDGGAVTTGGSNAYGLHARINNFAFAARPNQSSVTTLLTGGVITTTGDSSTGLYSLGNGNGAVLAQMDGGTVNTAGRQGHGLYSSLQNSNSTGSSTALLNAGAIVTTGNAAVGISSLAYSGNVVLARMNDGTVTTSGIGSQAVLSRAFGSGASLAQMDGGVITTHGERSYGLYSYINNSANTADATSLLTEGTITTNGRVSNGLSSTTLGQGNTLAQVDGGSITTAGVASYGLYSQIANATSSGTATSLLTAGNMMTKGVAGHGLYSLTRGLGNTLAQMDGGTVTTAGDSAYGLYSYINNRVSSSTATTLLTGGDITTTEADRAHGLYSRTSGLGNALAQMNDGTITTGGDSAYGLHSFISNNANTGTATTLLTTGDITTTGDNALGLYAKTSGSGAAKATVSGAGTVTASGLNADGARTEISQAGATYSVLVTDSAMVTGGSGNGAGIHTVSVAGSAGSIDITAGATVDGSAGMAILDGAGNTTINVAGTVIGDTVMGLGDDTFNLSAGSHTGDIYGDNVLASGADGDDTFNWNGGALNSGFFGGNGSDAVTISNTALYDGTEIFDGGDDISTADSWTDTLTFQGITATASAASVINWENIIIDSGTLTFADAMLAVGSDAGTGLTLRNNGTLNAAGGFALIGNLNNGGVISTQNGMAGDVVTISGNYIGNNGQLNVDTALGDDSSNTDKIVIHGDSSGATTINVLNVGGTGAPTASGIEILQVDGTDTSNLALNGDFVTGAGVQAVIGGAYGYTLVQQPGGKWALVSVATAVVPPVDPIAPATPLFQPAAPIYEAFALNLLTVNKLPTLQQRVGNRRWANVESNDTGEPGRGVWTRIIAGNRDIDSDATTTSTNSETRYKQIQIGLDAPLNTSNNHLFIAGINASYGQAKTDVNSRFGHGDIDSDSYNLGLTGTWYANNGIYADGQLQYSATKSKLDSKTLGELADDMDGKGIGASIEIGRQIELGRQIANEPNNSFTFTPQAQLSYNRVDFDSFNGPNAEYVSLDDGEALTARLGLSLNHQAISIDHNDRITRHHIYGLANIVHEFDVETQVKVSGTHLRNKTDKTFGELGLGGSYNWNNDKYSIYGELVTGSSLETFGDSRSYSGTIGFRMLF